MDRVDGGVVYRGELERDYNVSTLEPVIVGPDFTDPPEDANDSLRNIDNVYAMEDGRVICCEDGFGGPAKSFPNDSLYVFQPNVLVDVASLAVGSGSTGTTELYASSLPSGFAGAQVTVSVSDPEVASITGVSFSDALALTESSIADDGSEATLRVSDAEGNVQPGAGEVTLASLQVRAESTGTTDLVVDVERMDDENGNAIDAESRMGVFVGGPEGPPAVDDGEVPRDLDDDGLYEDVNGNGRLDYDDIALLFEHFESDAVRLNEAAYDFNENGRLDYDDLAELYEEIN
jgi:PKD repeat protein